MLTTVSLKDFYNTKEVMDDFYKVRKEIFVDRLKWQLPLQGDKEIDQFDHEDCHYLISSKQDSVIGGARLTSSLFPNLTFDYFQEHLPFLKPVERRADLLELSRVGLKPVSGQSSSVVKDSTLELMRGIYKFALDHNYKKIIAVTERRIERLFKFINLPITHISEIKEYDKAQVFIGIFDVSLDHYQELDARYQRLKY